MIQAWSIPFSPFLLLPSLQAILVTTRSFPIFELSLRLSMLILPPSATQAVGTAYSSPLWSSVFECFYSFPPGPDLLMLTDLKACSSPNDVFTARDCPPHSLPASMPAALLNSPFNVLNTNSRFTPFSPRKANPLPSPARAT